MSRINELRHVGRLHQRVNRRSDQCRSALLYMAAPACRHAGFAFVEAGRAASLGYGLSPAAVRAGASHLGNLRDIAYFFRALLLSALPWRVGTGVRH